MVPDDGNKFRELGIGSENPLPLILVWLWLYVVDDG